MIHHRVHMRLHRQVDRVRAVGFQRFEVFKSFAKANITAAGAAHNIRTRIQTQHSRNFSAHVVQGLSQMGNTLIAYSLGNCVFGGNTDPSDTDACLLGATLRFSEGSLRETQVTLWPIRTSGDARRNDYQPVLFSGSEAARVMDKIQARSTMNRH